MKGVIPAKAPTTICQVISTVPLTSETTPPPPSTIVAAGATSRAGLPAPVLLLFLVLPPPKRRTLGLGLGFLEKEQRGGGRNVVTVVGIGLVTLLLMEHPPNIDLASSPL